MCFSVGPRSREKRVLVRTEPTAEEVGFLLEELDASTGRVAASLGAVDEDGLVSGFRGSRARAG